jgi:hypothetical protein
VIFHELPLQLYLIFFKFLKDVILNLIPFIGYDK